MGYDVIIQSKAVFYSCDRDKFIATCMIDELVNRFMIHKIRYKKYHFRKLMTPLFAKIKKMDEEFYNFKKNKGHVDEPPEDHLQLGFEKNDQKSRKKFARTLSQEVKRKLQRSRFNKTPTGKKRMSDYKFYKEFFSKYCLFGNSEEELRLKISDGLDLIRRRYIINPDGTSKPIGTLAGSDKYRNKLERLKKESLERKIGQPLNLKRGLAPKMDLRQKISLKLNVGPNSIKLLKHDSKTNRNQLRIPKSMVTPKSNSMMKKLEDIICGRKRST